MDCSQGITFIPLSLRHKYPNMSVAPAQLWSLYGPMIQPHGPALSLAHKMGPGLLLS